MMYCSVPFLLIFFHFQCFLYLLYIDCDGVVWTSACCSYDFVWVFAAGSYSITIKLYRFWEGFYK